MNLLKRLLRTLIENLRDPRHNDTGKYFKEIEPYMTRPSSSSFGPFDRREYLHLKTGLDTVQTLAFAEEENGPYYRPRTETHLDMTKRGFNTPFKEITEKEANMILFSTQDIPKPLPPRCTIKSY